MDLNKIAVTLYDVLGYLLPGYLVLVAASVTEATFSGSQFLHLSQLSVHPLPFAIVAYYAGQITHAIASWTTESRLRTLVQAQRQRLGGSVYSAVRAELEDVFGSALPKDAPGTLEPYLLADSYLVAAGCAAERDLLLAREGFFKQSVIAASFALVVLIASAIAGGASVQLQPGTRTPLGFWPTVIAAAGTLAVFLLFRLRFGFYHRVKINNTLLLFLAVRAREGRKTE